IDDTIRRILDTGYCHHIERLMVLGGFMFLCDFDPDDVYRWFMEMFVDSYDWVMVPNTYAMSQHADGGLITTKPYFSGSNYVRKMSHWGKGDWADTWDGLYWRFINKHKKELGNNPRWAMMCRTAERMKDETREAHLQNAANYLRSLQ
ncbi:MAG: cryptochrome/photolyase family protein, partial [Pseudomonadota bacterium]